MSIHTWAAPKLLSGGFGFPALCRFWRSASPCTSALRQRPRLRQTFTNVTRLDDGSLRLDIAGRRFISAPPGGTWTGAKQLMNAPTRLTERFATTAEGSLAFALFATGVTAIGGFLFGYD